MNGCLSDSLGKVAMAVGRGQVGLQPLFGGDGGDLQHPCGGVSRGGDGVDPRNGLKVAHHVAAVVAQGPIVDHLAAPLQQQQLIKRLSDVHARKGVVTNSVTFSCGS